MKGNKAVKLLPCRAEPSLGLPCYGKKNIIEPIVRLQLLWSVDGGDRESMRRVKAKVSEAEDYGELVGMGRSTCARRIVLASSGTPRSSTSERCAPAIHGRRSRALLRTATGEPSDSSCLHSAITPSDASHHHSSCQVQSVTIQSIHFIGEPALSYGWRLHPDDTMLIPIQTLDRLTDRTIAEGSKQIK